MAMVVSMDWAMFMVLLQLIMVTCGKVLIAGSSNDRLIVFLLLERGIDINSVDEKGMTALHHAVQNFYNYREEPLKLINKLLVSGANLKVKDQEGQTPMMLAIKHSQKGTVLAGGNLLLIFDFPAKLSQQRLFEQSLRGIQLLPQVKMQIVSSNHLCMFLLAYPLRYTQNYQMLRSMKSCN